MYEYYICDYCGDKIILNKQKEDERKGGILNAPIKDFRDLKLALCSKCLKQALKEINEFYNTNF